MFTSVAVGSNASIEAATVEFGCRRSSVPYLTVPPPIPPNHTTNTTNYSAVASTMLGGSVDDVYLVCGVFECNE